jgi:hypothetical protein
MIIRRRSQAAKKYRPTGRPYNAALPRQIHPICHKFRLSTEFTRDALTGRPLRYRIEAMIIISRPLFAGGRSQKNTRLRVAPTIRLCRVKFIPFVINSSYVQDSQRYALRASPTVSHRGDENERRPLFAGGRPQKITACGLVRRGFHVGSPLERFRHSLASMMAGLYEQRATAFSQIQMRLRRYKLKLTTTLRENLCA